LSKLKLDLAPVTHLAERSLPLGDDKALNVGDVCSAGDRKIAGVLISNRDDLRQSLYAGLGPIDRERVTVDLDFPGYRESAAIVKIDFSSVLEWLQG
jgi:hypothetical protein